MCLLPFVYVQFQNMPFMVAILCFLFFVSFSLLLITSNKMQQFWNSKIFGFCVYYFYFSSSLFIPWMGETSIVLLCKFFKDTLECSFRKWWWYIVNNGRKIFMWQIFAMSSKTICTENGAKQRQGKRNYLIGFILCNRRRNITNTHRKSGREGKGREKMAKFEII